MLKRLPLAMVLTLASSAWGQQVISAHSGVVHFIEGQVTLDGHALELKFGEFPDVKNGQTLATQDGRAEVLLTPGVVLRIGEDSSFKMISNNRSDTRLELVSGSAVVEVGELLASNSITLIHNDEHMALVKKGLYRLDTDPAQFRVYDGEARVTGGDQSLVAHKGREVLLGAVFDMKGFDVKDTDALMRWAARRSEYLSEANISAARTASASGYGSSGMGLLGNGLGTGYGYGSGYGSGYGYMGMGGMWAYNPWYGMFTYMPFGNSMFYSPFGYAYYSPMNVGYFMPTTNTGSAFPISTASTSPHYSGLSSTGASGAFSPRGSYGASSATAAASRGSVGPSSGGSSGGSRSSGGFSGGSSAGGGAHAAAAGGGRR